MLKIKCIVTLVLALLGLAFLSLPCLAEDSLEGFMTKEMCKELRRQAFMKDRVKKSELLCDSFDDPSLPQNDIVKEYCMQVFYHVEDDANEIITNIEKAYLENNPYAIYLFAILASKYNPQYAYSTFKKADAKGVKEAALKLSIIIGHNNICSTEHVVMLKKAIRNGSADALAMLGLCHLDPKSEDYAPQTSLRLFAEAAEKGNANGFMNLLSEAQYGDRYGIQKGAIKALKNLKQKAEAGDSKYYYLVGLMYEKGVVVKKNKLQAAQWYKKSAESGCFHAAVSLEMLLFPDHTIQ